VPDPQLVDGLVRAGGWTLFVFTIALIGIGAVRGWWVPGWIYTSQQKRLESIDAALVALTDAVKRQRRV